MGMVRARCLSTYVPHLDAASDYHFSAAAAIYDIYHDQDGEISFVEHWPLYAQKSFSLSHYFAQQPHFSAQGISISMPFRFLGFGILTTHNFFLASKIAMILTFSIDSVFALRYLPAAPFLLQYLSRRYSTTTIRR